MVLPWRRLFRLASAGAAAALAADPACAEIVDNPHFNVRGLVVVWAADSANAAPVVSDFVVDTAAGAGDADLIADDVHTVVTGALVSTHDSVGAQGGIPFVIENTSAGTINTDADGDGLVSDTDAFTAFGLQVTSDARVDATSSYSSFYVAANTAFAIDAQAVAPTSLLDLFLLQRTRMQMSVTQSGNDGLAFGSSAQFPHSGGASGGVAGPRTLWSLRNGARVFTGNQRTAAAPGSLADQSVRFDVEYAIGATSLQGYDLSFGVFDFEVDMVYTVFAP